MKKEDCSAIESEHFLSRKTIQKEKDLPIRNQKVSRGLRRNDAEERKKPGNAEKHFRGFYLELVM